MFIYYQIRVVKTRFLGIFWYDEPMSYYSYTEIEKLIGCEKVGRNTRGDVFVIMGFQRSGTSLLAGIVNACGINFGKENELKQPLITNPDGFFEHQEISALSWKYLKEAEYGGNVDFNVNFHAKTWWQKLMRLITLRKMHNVLYNLSSQGERWGIKNFPLFYYIWKDYLPKHKIIGIYRDPYTATHSFLNIFWPSKFTYEYGLSLWAQAQRDMIYHLSQTESMLVRYEDLIDDTKNHAVIEKIVEFIGSGSVDEIKKMIKPSLNRMDEETSALRESYPSNIKVDTILETLNSIRSYE